YSPVCEAWLCGDQLLSFPIIFVLTAAGSLVISVLTVRYFWPSFRWILPVAVIWLASLLLLFINHEYEGLPVGALFALLSIIFYFALTEHTKVGISILAMGSNREAARLCGLPLEKIGATSHAFMALFVSLSALMEYRSFEKGEGLLRALDLPLLGWG